MIDWNYRGKYYQPTEEAIIKQEKREKQWWYNITPIVGLILIREIVGLIFSIFLGGFPLIVLYTWAYYDNSLFLLWSAIGIHIFGWQLIVFYILRPR